MIISVGFNSGRSIGEGDGRLCCMFRVQCMNKIVSLLDLIIHRGGSLVRRFPIRILSFRYLSGLVVSMILLFRR